MKYILSILSALVLFSCATQKDTIQTISECPENGTCRFEKHQNTALIIAKDDIGSLYHQSKEQPGKTTFAYYYEQNKNEDYVDGHYIEEIRFEMDDVVFDKSFKNLNPNQILFGVFCYCKGKAGYYAVENALVSYDKKSGVIKVTLDEIIENQILKSIEIR